MSSDDDDLPYRDERWLELHGATGDHERIDVPPHIWQRIVAELGLTEPSAEIPERRPGRIMRWRRGLLAAAAVVALAAAGVAGWAIGHSTSPSAPGRSAQATLSAQPGMAGTARGAAVVHSADRVVTMSVSTTGLPAPQGYYEVWLFDPVINQMVAVGTLGAGARGSFTVPAGLDLGAYHVVDVSAQKYNGDNAHQRSVLRGSLAR